MTQQYLAGELSLLLGELQAVAPVELVAGDFARLRHEAERVQVTALRSVAARALALTDGVCWESLSRADAAGFDRQAMLFAELHDFGVCAGLIEDG